MHSSRLALPFLLVAAACGGSSSSIGDPEPSMSSGGSASASAGPQITLSVRGTVAPVAHADGFAGETPIRQIVAVNSLWLYRSADDPSPLKVADLGAKAVESDLVAGTLTDVATVATRSLPAGTFTLAKVGAAYVRYSVAARMHNSGVVVDGRYDNVQALSDSAVIDGQTRNKGWYRFAFAVGATTYGALEGANAPLPQLPSGGGMTLETKGPDAFYAFPVSITIDPNAPNDQRIVCEVGVHESFRWQDETRDGYARGVYDTTPTTYEPVMAFGATSFTLSLAAK
jgi:hypothetical protein